MIVNGGPLNAVEQVSDKEQSVLFDAVFKSGWYSVKMKESIIHCQDNGGVLEAPRYKTEGGTHFQGQPKSKHSLNLALA